MKALAKQRAHLQESAGKALKAERGPGNGAPVKARAARRVGPRPLTENSPQRSQDRKENRDALPPAACPGGRFLHGEPARGRVQGDTGVLCTASMRNF